MNTVKNLCVVIFLSLFTAVIFGNSACFAESPVENNVSAETNNTIEDAYRIFGKSNVDRFEQMFQSDKFKFDVYRTYTVLHYAVFMNDLERVKLLIDKGADINKGCSKIEMSPLMLAVHINSFEMVKLLLEHGADVNYRDLIDDTPICYAAIKGDLELVKFFVKKGSDIKTENNFGYTLLHFAAGSGNVETMQWLIDQGLDVNAKSKQLHTCLNFAAVEGKFEAFQWLVKQGLDINAKDIEYAVKCMEDCGVIELKDKHLDELSGGQLQRVLLARTFAQRSPFLFLDEPGNNLDIKYRAELCDKLNKWAEEKTSDIPNSLVCVFHDLEQARRCCTRAVMMKEGRIVYDGDISNGTTPEMLLKIYDFDVASYIEHK